MDHQAPPTIQWQLAATTFLTAVVELDIQYLDVEVAIEQLVTAGLYVETTGAFQFEGRTIAVHKMPALFPGMRPLYIFSELLPNGMISVIDIMFRSED